MQELYHPSEVEAFPVMDIPDAFNAVVDMLNAKYGLSLTGDDVASLGQRIFKWKVILTSGKEIPGHSFIH